MEEKILEMLAEICEDEIVKENLDVELFESGLVDSLDFAEMLIEIEDKFSVSIAPSEIERTEIDTPRKLIAIIIKKGKQEF